MDDTPVVSSSAVLMIQSPMCEDLGCPSRNNCFRHQASGRVPRAQNQPYFAEPTRDTDATFCPFYWPLKVQGLKPKVRRVSAIQRYTINNDPDQIKAFISRKEVANMLGIQPGTVDRLCRRSDVRFPQPIKLGNKNKHWVRVEVEEFLRSDEVRGIGVRGKNANVWKGARPDQPAYPFVWE